VEVSVGAVFHRSGQSPTGGRALKPRCCKGLLGDDRGSAGRCHCPLKSAPFTLARASTEGPIIAREAREGSMLAGELALTIAAAFTGTRFYINVAERQRAFSLTIAPCSPKWKPRDIF